MCTEVYNLFGDIKCQHKEYQNTFPCHIARRCSADDDQPLKEPIFLPARPPNVPPGLLGCKVRRATRPVTGKCRDCRRRELQVAQSNNIHKTAPSWTSASSVGSSKSTVNGFIKPSPDHRALAKA
ncbi:hypothetical protein EKO27_g1477 [Xylaria grammica]|uniref:Uncharacterized protein n=1 Tax=Xylaria grammica TaxID=363999 RepID=A0A439DGV8_9PEZI|nr:hypothetical protein EKO27_g1477 [Xylaria grammica]